MTLPTLQVSTQLNPLDLNGTPRRNPIKTVPASRISVETITNSAPQESRPKSPTCQRRILRGHDEGTNLLQNASTQISPSSTTQAAAKITPVPQASLEVLKIDVQSQSGNSLPSVHTPLTQSVFHPQQVRPNPTMPSSALSLAASEASTLSNMTAKEYPHRTRLRTKTDETIKISNNFRDSSIQNMKKALEQDLTGIKVSGFRSA